MIYENCLRVGGWVPFTTVDFPGHLAAVLFLQGCPARCPYCHNSHLQGFRRPSTWSWKTLRRELEKRRGLLDGLVFSGGEPTAQSALAETLAEAKEDGWALALHTAGLFPERLSACLPYLDWIGLDLKAPPDERMDELMGVKGAAERWRESYWWIRESGVAHTIRTTVDPRWVTPGMVADLQEWLQRRGAAPSRLQTARTSP
jgi:pyruvate formate lyase activating enzyme